MKTFRDSRCQRSGRKPCPSGERGLSLVELMVAMVVGLLFVTALTKLFIDLSRANQEMAKTNGQIESARFAMQFLGNDIIHGGYWGGFVPEFDNLVLTGSPTDTPTLIPDPCLSFTTPWTEAYMDSLLGIPVQTYGNGQAIGTCGPGGADIIDSRLAGTDAMVVRHAETCTFPADANCAADVAGALYFQPSNCEVEIADGFPYALGTSNFIRYQRDCDGASGSTPPTFSSGTPALKRKFIQTVYYIRDYAAAPGDGIPTLVRSRLDSSDGVNPVHLAAEALVPGIERFRVELGIDNVSETGNPVDYTVALDWLIDDEWDTPTNRGDGIPDDFVHCDSASPCNAALLTNVVAVKLYVLARSAESTPAYNDSKTYTMSSDGSVTVGPFSDSFKRHMYSSTFRLYNVSGRRETP